MTTPPKARRFHASVDESVRPTDNRDVQGGSGVRLKLQKKAETGGGDDVAAREVSARERMMQTGPTDDGFGDFRLTEPASGADKTPPPTDTPSTDTPPTGTPPDADLAAKLAAIKAENLGERQLRIARRIAQLHRIEVETDEEAVLRLREQGIDPSHRAALAKILSSEGTRSQAEPAKNTPALVAAPKSTAMEAAQPSLPSREALTEDRRAAEIYRIQRDMARRRRRRMMMLAMRLLLFVIGPTAVAGWYYFKVATPLYATQSQFQIQVADTSGLSPTGNALSGIQANTDAVAVQSYLSSREAMLRLDAEEGFRAAFQDPALDQIKRLAPDASNEAAYGVYQDSVKISYDPTEGMIDLEVIAPDPDLSRDFSLALIRYAEGQVDQMTSRLRDDQMKGAIESYQDAEARVLAAQRRVQDLQQRLGVLDPVAEGSVVMSQIAALENQLNEKELELGQLLANARPQQSRVDAVRGDISRLNAMIAQTRLELTEGNETRSSLAAISGELRIAESDLTTRQELLSAAAAQVETARIEANKQVRYLSLSVAPVPPDEPTYPKAFQNTLVALLIFSGIYLMLSLTASILREQVST